MNNKLPASLISASQFKQQMALNRWFPHLHKSITRAKLVFFKDSKRLFVPQPADGSDHHAVDRLLAVKSERGEHLNKNLNKCKLLTSTNLTLVATRFMRLWLSTWPQKRMCSPGTYPHFGSQHLAVMGPDWQQKQQTVLESSLCTAFCVTTFQFK